jgi:hypothetical protein
MLATHLLQDLVAAYDAPVNFVQEHLATELPRFAHLLATYDLGMLLKEAQDLLGCRHLLIVEDAASRLSDPLLYEPQEVLELLREKAPGPTIIVVVLPQRFDDPYRLSAARLGDRDELLVSLSLSSLRAFSPLRRAILCSR